MHQPDALLGVPGDVRRELRAYDEVDPPAVRLLEIEHAPEERLRQDAGARIPLERDGDEVGLVPSRPELRDQLVGEDLGAAPGERHLRPEHRDPHGSL